MISRKRKRLKKLLIFLRFTNPNLFYRLTKILSAASKHESRNEGNSTTMPDDRNPIDASQLSRLKALDIISFNSVAESLFVILITDYIKEDGPQSVAAIYAEAAFELDISIETAKRYLLKHTARRAEFQIIDKTVSLRKEINNTETS